MTSKNTALIAALRVREADNDSVCGEAADLIEYLQTGILKVRSNIGMPTKWLLDELAYLAQ